MKKVLVLSFIIINAIILQAQQIKNTNKFIEYLKTAQNVKEYFSVKQSIQTFTLTNVINSGKISNENKQTLKRFYDSVQSKSVKVYTKLRDDLLNTETRKTMLKDIDGYLKNINNMLIEVKTSSDNFYAQYTSLTGVNKSFIGDIIAFVVKNVWPVLKSFIREQINEKIKKLMDDKLQPLIVIKLWDDLNK
jgi:uncharacterized protein YfkK (UPF0435 family)